MTTDIILTDKNIKPSDDLIFSIIKENKVLWQRIMKHAEDNYKGSEGEWNYYNDGKRWLFKLVRKKKTIFWIGITEESFRVTFWFGDKVEPLIIASELPDKIKTDFHTSKKYGAVRAVSIIVKDDADADNVISLMAIKSA